MANSMCQRFQADKIVCPSHLCKGIFVAGVFPYRNDKVVTRLWSPCNLVTTLRKPCHNLVVYSQSLCNLAATLSNPSQGCDNLVTTL